MNPVSSMISTPRPGARPHNRDTGRAPCPTRHATEPAGCARGGGPRSLRPTASRSCARPGRAAPPDTGPLGAAAPDARTTHPPAAATPPTPHAQQPPPPAAATPPTPHATRPASTPIPSRTKTSDIHHQALLTMRDGEGAPQLEPETQL